MDRKRADITGIKDIEILVETFYGQARKDPQIGTYFNDLIEIDWDSHFPRMFTFWESVLFGTASYQGNAMTPHFKLHQLKPFVSEDFDKWYQIWEETVDKLFDGPMAENAKEKAKSIKELMKHKILGGNSFFGENQLKAKE